MANEEKIRELEAQVEKLKHALLESKAENLKLSEKVGSRQGWSGTWEMDLINKEVIWSDDMYLILEVDKQEKPDMRLLKERLSPQGLDKLNGAISRTFVSGTDYSFEHGLMLKDKELHVRSDLKPVYNEAKVPIKLMGRLTDITATKSAQKELEKLSVIAAQTSNAVAMLDIDAKIDWVNSAFTRMTGYRPDEVKEKDFDMIITDESICCRDVFAEAFKRTDSSIQESQVTAKSGQVLWVVLNASPVLDYELNPESYIVIITDITEQKLAEQELERQHVEITDSINYAQKIQEAILPSTEHINEGLKDHFVLFKPKDIVSGDFYWFTEKEGKALIAAADCTGHGVPGAFISMIGNSLLNELVNENNITQPGQILDGLKQGVISALKQTGEAREQKDGMDIGLLSIDKQNRKIEYAGAYNPLLQISNGELKEIKADRMPIGIYEDDDKTFTNYEVPYKEGDTLYIFTDGFQDQFGGPKGKKFFAKQFKEVIMEIQDKSMAEQKEVLDKKFESWKAHKDSSGNPYEQIDDVCVIGVKV